VNLELLELILFIFVDFAGVVLRIHILLYKCSMRQNVNFMLVTEIFLTSSETKLLCSPVFVF